jgi:CheY-like chemotaxis protein
MYKILQIEDLPSDAYLIKREVKKVLDSCDFQIVEDKDSFITALREFKPDLIISDISIPGFNWQSALILACENLPKTPFIIVTGSSSEEIRNKCLKAGVTEFVSKNAIHKLGPAILHALK